MKKNTRRFFLAFMIMLAIGVAYQSSETITAAVGALVVTAAYAFWEAIGPFNGPTDNVSSDRSRFDRK